MSTAAARKPRARKALLAPDWGKASHLLGGRLREIPLPHVRFFPGPRLRRVTIQPMRVFRHYHTRISEEDNPLWNAKEGVWQKAWDDEGAKGRDFFKILNYPSQVERWAAQIVAKHFPASTHRVTDYLNYLADDEKDLPAYVRAARKAARRASVREGD